MAHSRGKRGLFQGLMHCRVAQRVSSRVCMQGAMYRGRLDHTSPGVAFMQPGTLQLYRVVHSWILSWSVCGNNGPGMSIVATRCSLDAMD